MNKLQGRLAYILLSGLILTVLIINSVPTVAASRGPNAPTMPYEATDTPLPPPSPTSTATPVTGLIFTGWTKGCTSGPYITCSATVTSVQTDPYRWDFDITYTYNDNRTNMGSNFTLTLVFDTGVFYTGVPIWWEMYPITNEVMPNRRIDVFYSGVPDLDPMSYPSGLWTIPSQPSPYDTFRIKFSRVTGTTETLVRTDSWHVTVATYDYHALTPTPTPTAAPTSTPSLTPTSMPTNTPTITPTPNRSGSGTCWASGASWPNYYANYTIDSSTIPADWVASINSAANTWTSVTPSHFIFYNVAGTDNVISKGHLADSDQIALASVYASTTTPITKVTLVFSDTKPFDTSNPPAQGNYSVENIATHEFGHWLMLKDINDTNCSDVTMYWSAALGEIKKISLETADQNAINWQYP